MNTTPFERQLQDIDAPAPDPRARIAARRAALAEFAKLHGRDQQTRTRWSWSRPWPGGLATACLAVVGASIFWLLPERDRDITRSGSSVQEVTSQTAPVLLDLAVPAQEAPQVAPAPPARKIEAREAASEPPMRDRAADAAAPAALPPPIAMTTSPLAPAAATTAESDRVTEVIVAGNRIPSTGGLRAAFGPPATLTSPATLTDARRAPAESDRFEHFETNAAQRVTEQPVSTFSVDVDTTSYSFARRMLSSGALPPQDAVRVEEMINYFDYDWPAPESRREPFRSTVTVSDSPWGAGKKLVHIGIRGYSLPARSRPDVNLVLLLDVSGSMNSPDKLPLARRSMQLLLDSLKPTDTVAIVVYAGAAGEVLAPTPVRERSRIEAALDSLRAGGSTAGAGGIRLAYELAERSFRRDGINRILLATDGDFNVGVSDPDELKGLVERERDKGIYLSVLGFGQGNYRDDIAQALAQNGNGVAAYIDTFNEARKVLEREATSSLFPIASDAKIQVEFNPATVAEYRLVGYETRALNREDFNNDKVDAGEVGAGRTVTAIYEIVPVGSSAALIDARRYADTPADTPAGGRTGEYGFVKIRYKLPGDTQSRLMEQPIRVNAGVPRALRQDVEFATAVAGFGQLLRGGRYTGDLDYDDVIRQAQAATGDDRWGYRAEFIELVRRARSLQTPGDRD